MFDSKLKELRKKHGYTQSELAKLINSSTSKIAMWETGKRDPVKEDLLMLSELFEVSVDYLIGNDEKNSYLNRIDTIEIDTIAKVPIIGTVKAGLGGLAEEELLGYEYVYNNIVAINDCFYLKVKGDSMEPHIAEGDLALVRRQSDIESGTLAVVIVNGDEGVIKRIVKKPGVIELHSFNPYYPIRIFKGEELNIVRIVGKVIETKRSW